MNLDSFLKKPVEVKGPDSDIAISTRGRIARNIKGNLYFDRAGESERAKTLELILEVMKKCNFFQKALFLKMKDISEVDRSFLVERHLMSHEHTKEVSSKALVVGEEEIVSVMLNEEDHIRLQVIEPGFNVQEVWRILDKIDTELAQYLQFDYSHRFGYLTSCPTNTGTGLRASVMLHLSALVTTGQIDNVFSAISKLGLTMRGFYGEGTEALGDFFQISNQVSLGYSEGDILDNLERIIRKIITKERASRQELINNKKHEISDKVFRSYGTLKSAKIITSSETVKLLSAIRLGVYLGLVKDIDVAKINEVLLYTQPAHLQKIMGKKIEPYERDIKRADFIRERLGVT